MLTHGPDAGTLLVGDELHTVAPPPVEVLDTAGAGDAVAGAYLATRFAGADPRTALAHGVVAAALSCRGEGCARSYPSGEEVRATLAATEKAALA